MENPDVQATPSAAEGQVGKADTARGQRPDGSQQSAPAGPARRPHFRTYGVPIRAPGQRVRISEDLIHRAPAPPGLRFVRRIAQRAFINRNFSLLWWGQAVSSVGDYAWDTALLLWIATFLAKDQSWAPLAVAGAIIAAAVPQVVIGPIAGVFVDRWDKRRTMVIMTAIQGILAALLIIPVAGSALPGIGPSHIPVGWLLGITYSAIFLQTSCAQFFLPAQLALIKDIVPESGQDQAIEMTQAIQGLAVVIGPPVAAALVFGLGTQWALLLNAVSFALCFWAAVAIIAPPSASSLAPGEAGHFSREFVAGVSYVLRHKVLRTVLIAEILTWLGFGALQSLGYFFLTEDLHTPPSAYGWFGADFGLGAIVGGALVAIFGRKIGLVRILWLALITTGVFVIVMSHLTNFGLALVAAFFFGVAATAILISAGPLAIDVTEKDFVGRVTAVLNPVGRFAAILSVILAGALVGTVLQQFHAHLLFIEFDGITVVFTGMGALAIIGGIYTRIQLRDMLDFGRTANGTSHGQEASPQSAEAH